VLATWSLVLFLAQAPSSSPASNFLRVSGVVIDGEGVPVPDAQMAYTGNPVLGQTDRQGRFDVEARGPFLVIRKVGFQSVRLDLPHGEPVRVMLKPTLKGLPACSWRSSCDLLPGQSFCFPKVAGVTVSELGRDIDYVTRAFIVTTVDGKAAIRHGAGQFWSRGPYDSDVWKAEEYHETVYPFLDLWVRDARGRSPNGKYWRSLYTFQGLSEEASYRDADQTTAALFDRVIDGVCLRESEISKAARKAENRSKQ